MVGRISGDTRHLVRHNGHPTWHCVKDVPRRLQEAVGRKRLVRSLQTHDVLVARSRRWEVLADFERVLSAARAKTGPSTVIEAGLAWRSTLAALRAGDDAAISANMGHTPYWREQGPGDPLTPQAAAIAHAEEGLSRTVDEMRDRGDEAAAAALNDVAYGRATPLLHHVESWLAEGGAKGPLNPRTVTQYRADVNRLATWAKAAGLPETVETFTNAIAGRYVTETMVRPGVDPGTGNRWISAASAYWRWMTKRAGIEGRPWQGQSLAKGASRSRGGERVKRPLTDVEVGKLLNGSPDAELADLIPVGALSGMRLEEIYRLTVADCAGGWFRVRVSKTAAGVRRVPIHPDLAGIVTRRCEGKASAEFLFQEPGPAKAGRERSMAASQRFGRYRKAVGVHEVRAGRRASAVDFHSLRRWFITAARNAGHDRGMVAAVVGHEAGNITDDVYSGGPSDDLRRKVVESVEMPRDGGTGGSCKLHP